MAGSDNTLRDREKALRDRDKALRDGLAKALQAEAVPPPPPPKAKPARFRTAQPRIIHVLGGWIFGIPKAARRIAVSALGVAAGLRRGLAGLLGGLAGLLGGLAGLLRGLMRWQ